METTTDTRNMNDVVEQQQPFWSMKNRFRILRGSRANAGQVLMYINVNTTELHNQNNYKREVYKAQNQTWSRSRLTQRSADTYILMVFFYPIVVNL